jgi:NADH pyrophosphatase NudC (nudix superfamily)
MLHGQSVVAKILRSLADREMKPQSLRRFEHRRSERSFHSLKQPIVIIIARNRTTPDQFVVASRQQRRDRDRAIEAFAGFVETAELRE